MVSELSARDQALSPRQLGLGDASWPSEQAHQYGEPATAKEGQELSAPVTVKVRSDTSEQRVP
jgi:hypothetical protein